MKNLKNESPYQQLNAEQFEAVTSPLGHLLVLAGAGSGKTKVLVCRIAFMINHCQANPFRVLAVTFTNKAAQEMKLRLGDLIAEQNIGSTLWVGTFHGLAYRMIRQHAMACGLGPHFQVMDSDDQLRLIRRAFKSLAVNDEQCEPKQVQSFINRKKDEGIRAGAALSTMKTHSAFEATAVEIYRKYEVLCKENQVVDFAELLLLCYELLKNNPEILAQYQERFQHILVDEFQDTNSVQYRWLQLLAQKAQSVTVVGDDDQSIYGWRGAKIENIQKFSTDFANTTTIRLEQNYRSTQIILSAANALIAQNQGRLGKNLWTEGEKGKKIQLYRAFNEEDEALYVVKKVRDWCEPGGELKNIAVLYRSNAQSRVFEEAFLRAGVPYVIYGGLRFFERAEIKDALAYVRLMLNAKDNASFERVVNVPNRGIGHRSFEKIREMAETLGCSYWEATKHLFEHGGFAGKTSVGVEQFMGIVTQLRLQPHTTLSELMMAVVNWSGLLSFYEQQKNENAQSRVENLQELINACHDFELNQAANGEQDADALLLEFMAYASLDGNDAKKRDQKDAVQFMTLHAAKGLEFPLVFVCGMEDGLFPSHFSKYNPESIEEERRLCYVGITRAMQALHFTLAKRRRLFGKDEERRPSCFLSEIPENLIDDHSCPVYVDKARLPQHATHASPKGANPWITHWTNATWPKHAPEKASKAVTRANASKAVAVRRMKHPKFGPGTILEQEGEGEQARIHIHFDHYGHKWLALAFAKLEPLTEDSTVA